MDKPRRSHASSMSRLEAILALLRSDNLAELQIALEPLPIQSRQALVTPQGKASPICKDGCIAAGSVPYKGVV